MRPITTQFLQIIMDDKVNRPSHYEAGRKISPLAVLEDWHLGYSAGNMLKYLARWRRKDGRQDLEKLRWYGNRAIDVWKTLPEDIRTIVSKTQQECTQRQTISVQSVIDDWDLCLEEQMILRNIHFSAFHGDPMFFREITLLLDTWLTTRAVQEVDDTLHSSK